MTEQTGVACPECATVNPPGFRFCGSCGAPLMRACAACGAPYAPGLRFCGNCGAPLDAEVVKGTRFVVDERKLVSVVFADLEASTQLATRLDPEDLREVYELYFKEMAAQIVRFGGSVEKFIGDAVVGIFGAPAAHDDDPVRAVRAALAMQAALPAVNARLADKLGGELALRVAVHTGEVLASPAAEHESGVTGEATTIASRLQGVAPSGAVVVSERTQRDTAQVFEHEFLGQLELKGVAGTMPVWRAVREGQPMAPATRPPLIGRRDELDLLAVLLRRCIRERRPYVVTVVGPPGIGKSRLIAEFSEQAAAASAGKVVRGRCLAYGDGLRLWPLAQIVKHDAGILDSDPPETILDKTRDSIGARFEDSSKGSTITATLLSSLGIAVEPDPLAGAGRPAAERMMTEAWSRYFETLASGGALVAVIEDIHWADVGLLDLLERLAGETNVALLIVCLARPELYDRRRTWGAGRPNFATVELSPLSTPEERALVDNLLEDAQADEELVTAIIDRAEGNPFFATELLRMLRDDGAIELRDGRWRLARELPSHLPDTIQGVIAARLDRLAPPEKRALQDAAVVGRVFWDGALERLGGPDTPLAIEKLLERGLLRSQPSSSIAAAREFAFEHALIRDVAYASLPRARRREAHAGVLAWIEGVTRGRDEEFAELLAHHAMLAGDDEKTAHYAALAGHRHRRVYAAEEAIRWYDLALERAGELAPETRRLLVPEILHSRAETYEELGLFDRAADDFVHELELARATGRHWLEAHALTALTHVLWLSDEYGRAEALLPRALEVAGQAGTVDLEARLFSTAGALAWAQGDWSRALDFHRQALAVAGAARDVEGEAYARQGLADTLSFSGPLVQALEEGVRALELWGQLGQRPRQSRSSQRLAYIYLFLGRFDEAAKSIEETLRDLRELGQRRDEALTLAAHGLALLFRGELGAAGATLAKAVDTAREQSAPRSEVMARVARLIYAAELGAHPDRWQDLPAAHELSQRVGPSFRPPLLAAQGWRSAVMGDRATASQAFAGARSESEGSIFYALLCGRFELSAWEALSAPDELRDAASWLAVRARGESPPHEALAACALSRADASAGRRNAAGALHALELASHAGDATVLWRALGVAALRGGDKAQSEELSARFSGTVRQLVSSLDEDELREAFRARTAALAPER